MYKQMNVLSLVLVGLALAASALAAPLQPLGSMVDLSIEGRAAIAGPNLPPATYRQTSSTSGATDCSVRLQAGVTAGQLPAVQSQASSRAVAGVDFRRVAENEYMLTVSSKALGELVKMNEPSYANGEYSAVSHAHLQADFVVLGAPQVPQGAPATVFLHLEHVGSLSGLNRGMSTSKADVVVSGLDAYQYHNSLTIPTILPPGFDEFEIRGTRNFAQDAIVRSVIGGRLSLMADLTSSATGYLSVQEPFSKRTSAADFDSGLRLHMLVMPEPGMAALLALALAIAARRRRGA